MGGISRKPKRTSQGFLRVPAHLTRVGVLEYRQPDGSVINEFRPPEEVFHTDSLDSFEGAPLTDMHPEGEVNPDNVRTLQRGFVAGIPSPSGRFVNASIIVQDAALIEKFESKKRQDLSPGYSVRIENSPGVFEGQRYDRIQRDIRYNHIAALPPGTGRSGPEVAVRMDSRFDQELAKIGKTRNDLAEFLGIDSYQVGAALNGFGPEEIRADLDRFFDKAKSPPKGVNRKMAKIRIDGIAAEVSDDVAELAQKALDKKEEQIKTNAARADAAEARADAAEAERKKEKERADAATDPKAVAALVAARVQLENKASKILGSSEELSGKSDRDIKIAAILKKDSAFDPSNKSEDYLAARFDMLDLVVEDSKTKVADELDPKQTPETPSVDKARADMLERNAKMWQQPLSKSVQG